VSRRSLIAGAALVPVAALTSAAQSAAPSVFSAADRKTLEAFVDRLVPKDDLGPGALECGAVNYIDQALAGALADEKQSFLEGLAAIDAFARRTHDAPFADLSADQQDAVLDAMDKGPAAGFPNARAVFARFRRLTLEGMFSDPYYGGNTSFRGWDLIRYPGPRVAVSPEDQQIKVAIKPYRRSALGANNGHRS
ncbi:MAG TPA: gluconate 2-dehydrogenase subunit 3 family protein, partial [Bryobacteraceae bacterium]|nr:gluconate 2-dehydrogenase subunit 3 family protein [Bryobacteraceae bacterium]